MEDTDLTLRVGEREVLPLRSLATAGYRWQASVEGPDPDAIAVELSRGELPPGAPPGLSVPESAVITALKPGHAVVHLEQRRPWEGSKPPALTVELHVEVMG